MADSSPAGAPLDRYVVLEYLSEGGMGAIYVGKKMGAGGFEKKVVLKQLLPEFTSQPEFRDLFLREARLSATLDHANIVHTIDLVTAGDEFFIVMEYLPGGDLRTLLKKARRRRQRFSPAAAIYITREILSALAFAHAKLDADGNHLRLIHRDVSPSNILVSHDGEVKLTDFGIAKASTHNSVFYRVKGKVGYMSPEQARSETLDHRSDLYSLAVCLYEMVCGERLFVHAGLTTSAEEMYSQPVPLLSHKIEGVPAEFDQVLVKALHVDADHRYQTAGEFQEALLRCAHRASLMISAPELAAHLREVCGDPERWREVDDEAAAAVAAGGGTEVYDPAEDSTELLDTGALESVVDVESVDDAPSPAVDDSARKEDRSRSSIFDLNRLRKIELTSMINLAELQPEGDDARGAQPLVDLDALGSQSQASSLAGAGTTDAFDLAASVLDDPDPPPHPAGAWTAPHAPHPGLPAAGMGAEPVYPTRPGAPPQAAAVTPTRSRSRVWLVLALILLLGVIAAVVVGLSGPKIEEGGDPAGLGAPPGAPPDPPSAPAAPEAGAAAEDGPAE